MLQDRAPASIHGWESAAAVHGYPTPLQCHRDAFLDVSVKAWRCRSWSTGSEATGQTSELPVTMLCLSLTRILGYEVRQMCPVSTTNRELAYSPTVTSDIEMLSTSPGKTLHVFLLAPTRYSVWPNSPDLVPMEQRGFHATKITVDGAKPLHAGIRRRRGRLAPAQENPSKRRR
jgi:hypothetical protein